MELLKIDETPYDTLIEIKNAWDAEIANRVFPIDNDIKKYPFYIYIDEKTDKPNVIYGETLTEKLVIKKFDSISITVFIAEYCQPTMFRVNTPEELEYFKKNYELNCGVRIRPLAAGRPFPHYLLYNAPINEFIELENEKKANMYTEVAPAVYPVKAESAEHECKGECKATKEKMKALENYISDNPSLLLFPLITFNEESVKQFVKKNDFTYDDLSLLLGDMHNVIADLVKIIYPMEIKEV